MRRWISHGVVTAVDEVDKPQPSEAGCGFPFYPTCAEVVTLASNTCAAQNSCRYFSNGLSEGTPWRNLMEIWLVKNYNDVIIPPSSRRFCGHGECRGCNEVERPQFGGAGCGCPSARLAEALHWSKILRSAFPFRTPLTHWRSPSAPVWIRFGRRTLENAKSDPTNSTVARRPRL